MYKRTETALQDCRRRLPNAAPNWTPPHRRGETAYESLPTGTVTFLFTDIGGSAALLQRLGDPRYAEADGATMPLPLKLAVTVLGWMSFLAAVLFVPAGTVHWWRGWVFIGMLLAGTAYAVASLLPDHRELIEERLKPPIQREQPLADKIVLMAFLAAFYGWLAFIAFDVFHLRLLGAPGLPVSSLGLMLIVAGWIIAYMAVRENAFAALVVKHSARQTVIDTSVYGVVRHPMYAGAVVLLLGIPLWLESYAGALAALVPIAAIAARALEEERFLRRELAGYAAYTDRVRYRLIPFIW